MERENTEIRQMKSILVDRIDRLSYRNLVMLKNLLDSGRVCNQVKTWRDAAAYIVKGFSHHIESGEASEVIFGERRVGLIHPYTRISLSAKLHRDSETGEYVVMFKCGTYNMWLRLVGEQVMGTGQDSSFFSCLPEVDVGDYLTKCRIQVVKTLRQAVKPQRA